MSSFSCDAYSFMGLLGESVGADGRTFLGNMELVSLAGEGYNRSHEYPKVSQELSGDGEG